MGLNPSETTKRSSQYMDNLSFDETFNQNTVEILGYDGSVLRRVLVDTSGSLSVNLAKVGGGAIALGSTTAASSLPVSIATDNNISKETGGNLATVKTNTDPLVTAGGGGYVRQDSTATIAKETGGNLASIKTNSDTLAGAVTSSVVQTNTKQINGIAPSMGSGASGTGVQRVILATDQTAIPVNANQGTFASTNITAAAQTASVSVSNFSNVTITFSGTYAGATVIFEYTPSSTYFPVSGTRADNQVSASTVTLTDNSTVSYNVAVVGATTFRVRCTAISSGTLAVGLLPTADSLYTAPSAGINNVGGTAVQVAANALNSTGGGIQSTNMVAQFDDVSPTAITENQFGNVRMSTRRELYGQIRDAAGNERGINVTSRNAALVEGPTASGSALAANPQTTGGLAKTALPTAVADAQVVNSLHDKFGRQVVVLNTVRDLVGKQATTITSSTGATTIVSAGGSGVFTDITFLSVTNTSATGTEVVISDGTVSFSWYVPPVDMRGGVLTVPMPATTANTAWTLACTTSVASIKVFAQWVKNQ